MRAVDSAEFAEWLALYQIEPWGDDWRQAGAQCAATVNVHRKRGGRRSDPDDFIPYGIKPDPPRQTEDRITRELDLIFGSRQFRNVVTRRQPHGHAQRPDDRQHRP